MLFPGNPYGLLFVEKDISYFPLVYNIVKNKVI